MRRWQPAPPGLERASQQRLDRHRAGCKRIAAEPMQLGRALLRHTMCLANLLVELRCNAPRTGEPGMQRQARPCRALATQGPQRAQPGPPPTRCSAGDKAGPLRSCRGGRPPPGAPAPATKGAGALAPQQSAACPTLVAPALPTSGTFAEVVRERTRTRPQEAELVEPISLRPVRWGGATKAPSTPAWRRDITPPLLPLRTSASSRSRRHNLAPSCAVMRAQARGSSAEFRMGRADAGLARYANPGAALSNTTRPRSARAIHTCQYSWPIGPNA